MERDAKWLLRCAIALMWWVSALLPMIPVVQQRAWYELSLVGLTGMQAWLFMGLAMLTDALCGACALWLRKSWGWWLQLSTVGIYSIILTISHSALWLDPFGALLKNIPIMALLFYMARTEKRN